MLPFTKSRRFMAQKADNSSLADEYNKGASIQELADKYDMEPSEVEAQVVTPVGSTPIQPPKVEEPASEPKKDK